MSRLFNLQEAVDYCTRRSDEESDIEEPEIEVDVEVEVEDGERDFSRY